MASALTRQPPRSHANLFKLVEIDAARTRQRVGRSRTACWRLVAALGAGMVAGLVGAFLWGSIVGMTGLRYELEWVPMIGTGFFVGMTVKLVGRGRSRVFSIAAAVITLLAGLGSCYLTTSFAVAWQVGGVGNFVLFGGLPLAECWRLYAANFGWVELTVLTIAVLEAYLLARHRWNQEDWWNVARKEVSPACIPDEYGYSQQPSCARGHSFHPNAGQPITPKSGSVVCSVCGEPFRVYVPVDLAAYKNRREVVQSFKALAVILPAFPVLVLLTVLSTSRWSLEDLVVSPDGESLAIYSRTSDGGGRVRVRDLGTLQDEFDIGSLEYRIYTWKKFTTARHVAFGSDDFLYFTEEVKEPSPDGPGMRTASLIRRWDRRAQAESNTLSETDTPIRCLNADAATSRLALADKTRHVQLWCAQEGKLLDRVKVPSARIHCLALQPGGPLLAIGGFDGSLLIWDTSQQAWRLRAAAHRGHLREVDFSQDGRFLVSIGTFDCQVRIWRIDQDEILVAQDCDTGLDWLNALTCSPDGRTFAVAGGGVRRNGEIQLWDLSGKKLATFDVKTNTATCLAFAESGRVLIAGSRQPASITRWRHQGELHAWEVETGNPIDVGE